MAAHSHLKNEFMEDEKKHNLKIISRDGSNNVYSGRLFSKIMYLFCIELFFRMTDLGSVTYDSLPDLSKGDEPADSDKVKIDIPAHPRKFQNKPRGIPRKQQSVLPPTIQEAYSQEQEEEVEEKSNKRCSTERTAKADIQGIFEIEEISEIKPYSVNMTQIEDNKTHNGDVRTRSLKRTNAVVVESVEHELENESRELSDADKSFGSGDLLTDHDSLEKVDKIGYTNVIADVTVHECNTAESVTDNAKGVIGKSDCVINKSEIGAQGEVSGETTKVCSGPCNKTVGQKVSQNSDSKKAQINGVCSSVSDTVSDGDTGIGDSVSYGTLDSSVSVDEIEIDIKQPVESRTVEEDVSVDEPDTADRKGERTVNIEKIERQIVGNGSNRIHVANSVGADTDCNKNQTKGPVTFQQNQDGEITKDTIEPVHSSPLEGKPPKTATGRRESWASRKLRKTFGLKDKDKTGDKDEEDEVDGKGIMQFLYHVLGWNFFLIFEFQ